MGYELVGQVWTPESFGEYVKSLNLSWAQGVTIHHTAYPDLSMRPRGFTAQHLRNLESYYRGKGWSAGPHLFIDEDQIWGMSSLERRGVHARSFNATHIGIEVLGNYDRENPFEGRGADCWEVTRLAVMALLERMGRGPSAVNFHRDDPRTSKNCPGSLVNKERFLAKLKDDRTGEEEPAQGEEQTLSRSEIGRRIAHQAEKLDGPQPDVAAIKLSINWLLERLS